MVLMWVFEWMSRWGSSERVCTYVQCLYTTVLSSIPGTARRLTINLKAVHLFLPPQDGMCRYAQGLFNMHVACQDRLDLMTLFPAGHWLSVGQ